MKKVFLIIAVVAAFTVCEAKSSLNSAKILICRGSGENCMTIERSGLKLYLVKEKGSVAVEADLDLEGLLN